MTERPIEGFKPGGVLPPQPHRREKVKPAGWLAMSAGYGSCVVPIRDLVEHTNTGENVDEDCICGPTWTPVELDDGELTWCLVHHSLDGREQRE